MGTFLGDVSTSAIKSSKGADYDSLGNAPLALLFAMAARRRCAIGKPGAWAEPAAPGSSGKPRAPRRGSETPWAYLRRTTVCRRSSGRPTPRPAGAHPDGGGNPGLRAPPLPRAFLACPSRAATPCRRLRNIVSRSDTRRQTDGHARKIPPRRLWPPRGDSFVRTVPRAATLQGVADILT